MNKSDEDKVYKIVANALNDVMIPAMEDMENRINKKFELTASSADIDRVERKIDAQQDHMDDHDIELKDHEERIQVLEVAA